MEQEKSENYREIDTFWLLYRVIRGDKSVLPELFYRGGKFIGGGLVSSAIYLNKKIAEEVSTH